MKKEIISDKQGISLIVLFMIGESSILVSGLSAKEDLWLSILLSIVIMIPFMILYCNLLANHFGKDLFQIIELYFGKIIGKIIILFYTLYFFDLVAIVLKDFGNLVTTTNFPETPIIIPMVFILILCSWIVKEGIEVIGRWGEVIVIIPVVLTFIAIIFLIPNMDLRNIIPSMNSGVKPVIKGAYEVFMYPLGETVVFTIAFSTFKNKKSVYKIFINSLLIGGIFLLITSLTIILVLGVDYASSLYFPLYATIARVNVGSALQRIEAISAIVYLLGGFIKISIYLLAACKGIAEIFKFKDYRFIVMPVSLLAANLSYFEFDSIISFNEWVFDVWIYYAFPFIVILPTIIFIVYKVRNKLLLKHNM
ncbi:GerAB/ArcD/ProY family transporter [Maledivibacter halophilus]|uniref:Spore germination protein KB n=1 Tax=Maledivibacter halophilus TaxID=36842 RepID=A0A1T5MAA0_9FIRM|nr:endospore germination permease [Maledivibacter halophilus]SKC84779.1 spore germination protein KB [Maledivibacter halophilus]